MVVSPESFNLNSRTKLAEVGDNHIAIVKRVKSRIIQKDTLKIIAMVEQIKAVEPNLKVSLICNDNICSKSIKLLSEKGINIRY